MQPETCAEGEEATSEDSQGQQCNDDGTATGITLLEHVNINLPDQDTCQPFYGDLLGMIADPRKATTKGATGTQWFNAGISQVHLPKGDAQVIPGHIGLVHPNMGKLKQRLGDHTLTDCLKDTKFDWAERPDGTVAVTGPFGNTFIVYQSEQGSAVLDTRGAHAHGRRAEMLGMAYVELHCKRGAAQRIGEFYEKFLEASVLYERNGDGAVAAAVVRAGPLQSLVFREVDDGEISPYDGHHVAIYLASEAVFTRAFNRLHDKGLIFVNMRPRFGRADTLEKALEERQFRIKDLVDPSSGELVHELEHEVRMPNHKNSPFGKTGEENYG